MTHRVVSAAIHGGHGGHVGHVRRRAAASFFIGAALAALAYAVPVRIDVGLGDGLEGALVCENFHDPEGDYRWSRGRSAIVFPDPGATGEARLELVLSGFRPRGAGPPLVVVDAGDTEQRLSPSRRIETYPIETSIPGVFRSTLVVRLRSDVFTPGGGDERSLGVRLHRARLVLGPSRAPLEQVFAAGLLTATVFFLAFLKGLPSRRAFFAAIAVSVLLALGFALVRLFTAWVAPRLALVALGLAAVEVFFPWASRFAADVGRGSARGLLLGSRAALGKPWPVLVLALAAFGTFAAVASAPTFVLDLGSGEADPVAARFLGFDRGPEGTTFREALAGASLDLRDFGAGRAWTVEIRASVPEGPVRSTLAEAGERELVADLGPRWETYRFDLPPPAWRWRAGYRIEFEGVPAGHRLRIASVTVDRGRSLPSWRSLSLAVGAAAFFVVSLLAAGLSPGPSAVLGALFATGAAAAQARFPAVWTPFESQVFLIMAAALVAALLARGILDALAARELAPELPPAAVAVAVCGYVLWFLACASPLYSGGHFAYHTSIAEEIWHGKFFLYYFPGPDNMLSHQPQWGGLTVPHPSFYHSVTSPFAMLPRAGFYFLTKAFLSLLLFGIALISALVATAAYGQRAGIYAAAVVAGAPTGYQLLGLGHLMTIFGAWAAAAALGFIASRGEAIEKRREWWLALGLVTLCFLSYTGSLLFASVTLLLAAAALFRVRRNLSKRLFALVLTGWSLALLLYYVHWVVPFFRDTLPALAGGTASDRNLDLLARFRLEPSKLEYTFGSWLVPVVSALGLVVAKDRIRRIFLASWLGVLLMFSVLDLVFNFLLKHHYFAFAVVAVGAGLSLAWLSEKKLLGRVVLALFLVFLWVTGLREAISVALGGA